jgi:hypothetical protein
MYALAASAAGVGVMALVQPVEAKIVYTPAHVAIGGHGSQIYDLDLNHDGVTDFTLTYTHSCDVGGCFYAMGPGGKPGNAIEGGRKNSRPFARALREGAQVSFRQHFSDSAVMASAFVWSTGGLFESGPWVNVKNRYLGLKFKIYGKVHYGWARLNVSVDHGPIRALLTGYAYETIPNKPIIAGTTKDRADKPNNEEDFGPGASLTSPITDKPQPATLGALAMGAPGLSIWRREAFSAKM